MERFDDFIRLVTGEGEAGGCGVDLHGSTEGLLGAGCHANSISLGEWMEWIGTGLECKKGEGGGWLVTNLSASSRITNLCRPCGRVTFFCAKPFIRFLTTSMPERTL